MSANDVLLEAHETRLQRVEDGFLQLTTQLLPAMARVEAGVHSLHRGQEKLEAGQEKLEAGQQKLEGRMGIVEATDAAQKQTTGDRKKWAYGIAGTVVTAIILALLGISS